MTKPPKPKVNVRDLVARLNREGAALQEREIVAPLLPEGKIRTRVSGMIYQFKPSRPFIGWGLFRPQNEREAEPLGEAMAWQRAGYLEHFPTLRVVLLYPAQGFDPAAQVWLALPYNDSDAKQRCGFGSGELLPVFLCDPTGGADRFERVITRVDGNTLWFDGTDMTADPTHAEWLRDAAAKAEPSEQSLSGLAGSERLALLFWQIRQLEEADMRRQREQAKLAAHTRREQQELMRQYSAQNRLEVQLNYALEKAKATLHSYSATTNPDGTPGPLIVEWSANGQTYRYRSTIDPSLTVVSSGICLSGRDRDFDLTSLVNVVLRDSE